MYNVKSQIFHHEIISNKYLVISGKSPALILHNIGILMGVIFYEPSEINLKKNTSHTRRHDYCSANIINKNLMKIMSIDFNIELLNHNF